MIIEQINQHNMKIGSFTLNKLIFSSLFNSPLSEEQKQNLLNRLKQTHEGTKMFFKERIIKEKKSELKVNQMVNVRLCFKIEPVENRNKSELDSNYKKEMKLSIKNAVSMDTYEQFGSFKKQSAYYGIYSVFGRQNRY